jgi:hypothetical protein
MKGGPWISLGDVRFIFKNCAKKKHTKMKVYEFSF